MKKNNSGFTLVETIITVVILTAAAVGLMIFLISIQYAAEDNLHEATALTVALSTLEQMKSKSFQELRSIAGSEFDLITGNGVEITLPLNQSTVIQVPVVSNLDSPDNDSEKEIPITLTPSITISARKAELWIEVTYSYNHPRNGRVRTGVVRGNKNQIPTKRNF